MTTIAARVSEDGRITMASDRQSTNAYVALRTTAKVHCVGEALVGVAGPARMRRFLEVCPSLGLASDVPAWVDALETWCRLHDLLDRETKLAECTWLIGIAGRLFLVDGGFGITEATDGYAAIGSGQDVASGALHCGVSPVRALEAAVAHDPHTGGEIDMFWVGPIGVPA